LLRIITYLLLIYLVYSYYSFWKNLGLPTDTLVAPCGE
jgi:hypothetical protein